MDIRSKLGLYRENISAAPARQAETGCDVQDLMPGRICSNEYGSCYMVENRYPLTYLHGGCELGEALNVHGEFLSMLSSGNVKDPLESFLFLDTETTGLSGGAGTVAFLIGAGRFEGDSFVIRQYLMRDYDEETAMLHELNRLLSGFSGLVTFNGRAFDWNLLQGRFIANRLRLSLKNPIHTDLLYPSRRIWGLKLESCRLSSLEENILGEFRQDDIPGAMIPGVYFKYVEDRNGEEIKRVIKHNELDIISMVSLLTKITALLEDPHANTDGGHELLGIGRLYEAKGDHARMEDCLETCSKSEIPAVRSAAVRRLTCAYKKSGRYDRALYHWREMTSGTGIHSISPYIELAMYYEHKEKDFMMALEYVEKAIHLSLQAGIMGDGQFPELRKRQERLKRKVARNEFR